MSVASWSSPEMHEWTYLRPTQHRRLVHHPRPKGEPHPPTGERHQQVTCLPTPDGTRREGGFPQARVRGGSRAVCHEEGGGKAVPVRPLTSRLNPHAHQHHLLLQRILPTFSRQPLNGLPGYASERRCRVGRPVRQSVPLVNRITRPCVTQH